MVDIGCGEGAGLREFLSLGVDECLGVDGSYVQPDRLLIPKSSFRQLDLRKPFTLDRRFDLAISLEVGEHLPASSASGFVASLCSPPPSLRSPRPSPVRMGPTTLTSNGRSIGQTFSVLTDLDATTFFAQFCGATNG